MTKSEGVVVLVGCGGGDVVIKWLWWWHSVEVGLSARGGEPAVVKMTKVVGWSVEDGDEEMMVVAVGYGQEEDNTRAKMYGVLDGRLVQKKTVAETGLDFSDLLLSLENEYQQVS
ncbi:hypothetical protein Tco_0000104 [Tanacetum coccineum]